MIILLIVVSIPCMRLLFYYSGEHPALAHAEVKALLNTYTVSWESVFFEGQIGVYNTQFFNELSRLAMTHKILNLDFFMENKSFRVRVKRILSDVDSQSLEKKIADSLQKKYGNLPVDLETPEQEIYCIVQKNKKFIGRTIMDFPYSYEHRKPQYRPYFHPSSLDPQIARALVNLGHSAHEVLDPFCGTGGILIEAGLMGLNVKGLDVSPQMVEGTVQNLEHFGITDYQIVQGDVVDLDMHFDQVESVVTDMPYGKASRIVGSPQKLYQKAFESIRSITKKACIVTPKEYQFEKAGFIVKEHFILPVHKSLTRYVYVLE